MAKESSLTVETPRNQDGELIYGGNDSVVFRLTVGGDSNHVFAVRITGTAYAMSPQKPEDRVRKWFLGNPLPPHDAMVEIPEDYFNPRFF